MIPEPIPPSNCLTAATGDFATETAYAWWKRSKRTTGGGRNQSDVELVPTPTDPSSAAWAFFRPTSTGTSTSTSASTRNSSLGGTGIALIDAALLQRPLDASARTNANPHAHTSTMSSSNSKNPSSGVIEICGDHQTGKTALILSLAARFAVATGALQFSGRNTTLTEDATESSPTGITGRIDERRHDQESESDGIEALGDLIEHDNESEDLNSSDDDETDICDLPQVIVFDSTFGVDVAKLALILRSYLLERQRNPTLAKDTTAWTRQSNVMAADDFISLDFEELEHETNVCLSRIHVATSDHLPGWIAILESIRAHLLTKLPTGTDAPPPPTLLLWDGLLSEPVLSSSSSSSQEADAVRREVVRQLERLLVECNVVLVVTATTTTKTTGTNGVTCSTGNSRLGAAAGYDSWDRLVTHRIHLTRYAGGSTGTTSEAPIPVGENRNDDYRYMASVQGVSTPIPYSISIAGILS